MIIQLNFIDEIKSSGSYAHSAGLGSLKAFGGRQGLISNLIAPIQSPKGTPLTDNASATPFALF